MRYLSRRLIFLLACPVLVAAWPARTAVDQQVSATQTLAADATTSGRTALDLAASLDGTMTFERLDVSFEDLFASSGLWEDDAEWIEDAEETEELSEDEAFAEGTPIAIPIGGHTHGRLSNGTPFPIDDPRFNVLAPWRAYSAQATIDGLIEAVEQVEALYPGTPALTVGDISRKGGGRLSPHMSHQIGLDVDIGPFWADGDVRPLAAMHPSQMDMDRTWALLEALISNESVQYIILDYRLQQAFYEYARELPWMDDAYLEMIFQYPRGPKHFEGIIRHWYGHYSHFHVRFHCPEEFTDTCSG